MTEQSTTISWQRVPDVFCTRTAWPTGLEGPADRVQELLAATASLRSRLRHLSLVHLRVNTWEPLAATSVLALGMVQLQLRVRSGPVFEAAETGSPVLVSACERPRRFPAIAGLGAERGAASELAVPVMSQAKAAGALSVYWSDAADLDRAAVAMAQALAAEVGELIDLHRQVMNLREAMRTRELIGQACGVVMSRYRLTEEQAMQALRAVSQDRNVKLRHVAAEVAESGTLVEFD